MTTRMFGLAMSLGVVLAACSGAARDVFFDAVHQPLHQLADETATVDRAAAAALLQAKQRVESSLETADPPLAAALDDLIDTTGRALDTLDRPGPECGRDR